MAIAVAAVVLAPLSTEAHHSPAAFDLERTVSVEEVVERFHWTNPHVYIDPEVKGPDGAKESWKVEAAWPASLVPYGWSRETLEPGDRVEVSGSPARNGASRAIMGFSLRHGSGPPMVLNVRPGTPPSHVASTDSSDRAAMSAAAALTGTWLPLESDPLNLFTPSLLLTNEGREASAILVAASEDGAAVASCVPYPPPLNMAWQEAKGFESRDGNIVIRVAVDGDVERVVRMNGAPAERDRERNQGVSVGRWEGDTLVVETTFEELSDGEEVIIGVIPSNRTRLVERFELREGRSRLTYT